MFERPAMLIFTNRAPFTFILRIPQPHQALLDPRPDLAAELQGNLKCEKAQFRTTRREPEYQVGDADLSRPNAVEDMSSGSRRVQSVGPVPGKKAADHLGFEQEAGAITAIGLVIASLNCKSRA